MILSALVLHNVGPGMFFGYKPETARLHHAHEFLIHADNVDKALDLIWNLANIDDGDSLRDSFPHLSMYAAQVDEYRARMNRSLSVGDVIVLHELGKDEEPRLVATGTVDSIGFGSLDSIPEYEKGSNETPHSTSFDAHQKLHQAFNKN